MKNDPNLNPYIRGPNNWTPLHYAAINGSEKTIKQLLRYKDIDWFADDGVTPLHLAARHGRTSAVRQFLQLSGHDWNHERAWYPEATEKLKAATGNKLDKQLEEFFHRKTFTARELAVVYGYKDTAFAFRVGSGGDILCALSCACIMGDADMVKAILRELENRWFFSETVPPHGQARWFPAPPLHLATMSGDRATVNRLLESKAKVNDQSTNFWRRTFNDGYPAYSAAVHYAAVVGSKEILFDLERKGANLAALDHLQRTPLSYAVENGNEAAVERLIRVKYPVGWLRRSAAAVDLLGPGHVWSDKELKQDAISSLPIRNALEKVGIIFRQE